MTWSVIARDKATGQLGAAVAAGCFAVGARVPFVAAKIGAIATQGSLNPYYGIDGLELLRKGHSPREVLEMLTGGDVGQPHRQLQIIDRSGEVAAYTGERCPPWSSHASGDGFSVAATMVSAKRVVDDTFQAYI